MFLKGGKGNSRRTVVVVNSHKVNHNKLSRSRRAVCRGMIVVLSRVKEEERLGCVFLLFRPQELKTCGAKSDGIDFSGCQC